MGKMLPKGFIRFLGEIDEIFTIVSDVSEFIYSKDPLFII